jgi:small subunit ribosomal protein S24e
VIFDQLGGRIRGVLGNPYIIAEKIVVLTIHFLIYTHGSTGSFFRCLDKALTLAAILTNRDPFMSPMHLKEESRQIKNSWSPPGFRSDALATLQAYNTWSDLQKAGEHDRAHRFCIDNFLAKPTLLTIQKIKEHLLQSLYQAGVIDVSAGGSATTTPGKGRQLLVPPELNTNGDSLPLLAALIAIASQPKFAIRTGDYGFRTSQDKVCNCAISHLTRLTFPTDHIYASF